MATPTTRYAIHDQTVTLTRSRLLIVFGALSVALLISYIDQLSIGVVLPTIGTDLGSSSTIVWAGTASMISNAAFQPLYGRLSDIFGRKAIMLAALCLLSVADLLCGFAKTGTQLYAFRGLAGAANGGIMALAMMVISDITTLQNRGKYQGFIGSCVGLGNSIGPFIAAGFARTVGWRATFYFVAPLAVSVAGLLYMLLPPSTIPSEKLETKLAKIDYLGILCSSSGTILLLIPISGIGTQFTISENGAMVISMLVLGLVLLCLFIMTEWKIAKLPIFPLRLMRNPALAAMMAQNFLIGIVYYALLYYLPIYFQNVRREGLVTSAALLLPLVIPQSVSSALAGLYMTKKQRYGEVIWSGYVMWVLGTALQCGFFTRTVPTAAICIILVIQGVAVGLVFQPTLVAAQAHSPKQERAVVISARNFIRALGGSAGLAIASAVYSNTLLSHIPTDIPVSVANAMKTSVFALPEQYAQLSADQQASVSEAHASAARSVFYMWTGAMVLCLGLMILIKDNGLTREEEKSSDVQVSDLASPVLEETSPEDLVAEDVSEKRAR